MAEALRVLLIEDNPGDVRLVQEILSQAPAMVAQALVADTLQKGLELLDQQVDVVLLDLCLPDSNGPETVERVHQKAPRVPIVVITGSEDENVATRVIELGAEDLLLKTRLDAASMGRTLRYAYHRKRAEEHQQRLQRERAARAEAEAAEQRALFLAEAGRVLFDTIDLDAVLATAARLSVPRLGECCIIDLLEEGGEIRRVAHAGREDLCDGAPDSRDDGHPVVRAIKTGDVVVKNERMVVPLVARGRTLGAMQIIGGEHRRYGVDDVSLATELAVRTAMAIDTARMYRARDDMMSVVSHDLRNPLNVIGFAVASLKRPNITEEQRAGYVDKVRRAADRMNRLIEDLLDVGRLEAGRLPMERSAQPSAALLSDAIDAMRALAEERKVKLVAASVDKLPHVSADRERVLQVFSNLIGNALKFTPEGGTITLSAEASGSELHFTVSDTGPGIKKEDLGRIFDRFWQARRRDRQGAGLGLTIVKGIVTAHGGRIWAESDPGQGAVFHFTLPLAAETRSEKQPSSRSFVRAAARSR